MDRRWLAILVSLLLIPLVPTDSNAGDWLPSWSLWGKKKQAQKPKRVPARAQKYTAMKQSRTPSRAQLAKGGTKGDASPWYVPSFLKKKSEPESTEDYPSLYRGKGTGAKPRSFAAQKPGARRR